MSDTTKLGPPEIPKVAYLCDHKQCGEKCSSPMCLHTLDISHARNFEKIADGKYMEKLPTDFIYLITTFDKLEPDERYGYSLGSTRSVGFRYSFELAEEVVKTNMCDIWEYCYDYACVEELAPCLYPDAERRWFYKYNREINGYEPIEEPDFMHHHGPIGGIG